MLMNKILLMLTCMTHVSAANTNIPETHMTTLFKSKARDAAKIKKIIVRTCANYAVFKLQSNTEDKAVLQKDVSKALKVIAGKNEQQKKHIVTTKTRYANTFIKSSVFGLLGDLYTYIYKHTAKDAVRVDTSEDIRELDYMNVVLSEHDYVRYELDGLTKTAIVDEVCKDGVLTITVTDTCICNPIRVKVVASDNMSIQIEASMIAKIVCDEGRFALDISGEQVFLDIFSGNLINLNVKATKMLDGFIMNYSMYSMNLYSLHYHIGIHAKINMLNMLLDEFEKYSMYNASKSSIANHAYNITGRISDLKNGKGQCLYLDAMLNKQIAVNKIGNMITVDVN